MEFWLKSRVHRGKVLLRKAWSEKGRRQFYFFELSSR